MNFVFVLFVVLSIICVVASQQQEKEAIQSNETTVDDALILGDTAISCSPYQADACNCVYYARDRQVI